MFSSFLKSSCMFYHSVTHGLGFFICFNLDAQNKKNTLFYVLYSDKTWVFDQSRRAQGPIYTLKVNNHLRDFLYYTEVSLKKSVLSLSEVLMKL